MPVSAKLQSFAITLGEMRVIVRSGLAMSSKGHAQNRVLNHNLAMYQTNVNRAKTMSIKLSFTLF